MLSHLHPDGTPHECSNRSSTSANSIVKEAGHARGNYWVGGIRSVSPVTLQPPSRTGVLPMEGVNARGVPTKWNPAGRVTSSFDPTAGDAAAKHFSENSYGDCQFSRQRKNDLQGWRLSRTRPFRSLNKSAGLSARISEQSHRHLAGGPRKSSRPAGSLAGRRAGISLEGVYCLVRP